MTDRTIQPSALPADVAERLSDTTRCYARRPTLSEMLASNYAMRDELTATHHKLNQWRAAIEDAIAILRADNEQK